MAYRLVDFHSHILPAIDDGSASMDISLAMLEKSFTQGIESVVATPHFDANRDTPEEFFRRRNEAEKALRQEMAKRPNMPGLHIGAEVFYFPGISDSALLSDLTINNTPYVLIEMPTSQWTDHMYAELEGIYLKQGLIPIIAHLDRYYHRFVFSKVLKKLQKLPVLIQCNTEFFQHGSTQRLALRMLKKGQIHLLGSDCHDMIHRFPDLGDTAKWICDHIGDSWMKEIIENQEDILHG